MASRKRVMQNLVIEEATKLRNLITKRESENLSFSGLIPNRIDRCIYGQLTGNCNSERAVDLMRSCASRVYKQDSWDIESSKVNGSPSGLHRNDFWSPIEVFIAHEKNMSNGNNETLVKFLRKETDELNFV